MGRQARSQPPQRAEPAAEKAHANSAGSEALALIQRREDDVLTHTILAVEVAVLGVYMLLGNTSAALDHLQAALNEPSYVSSGRLRADPLWAPLRPDVRFHQLIAQN